MSGGGKKGGRKSNKKGGRESNRRELTSHNAQYSWPKKFIHN